MNREILFRGKRVEDGVWVEGYYLVNELYHSSEAHRVLTSYNSSIAIIPETVGQYTGLKDKNGNRIFEHDIVTDNVGNDGIVKWDHLNCRFIIFWGGASNVCLIKWLSESIEITGNIHENK